MRPASSLAPRAFLPTILVTLAHLLHAPTLAAAPKSNGAPTISGTPPATAVAGTLYDFRPTASDPNGDTLRFSINKRPGWATFDVATGRLHGTPSTVDVGRIDGLRISVTDGSSTVSLKKFSIRVTAGGAPTISGTPATTAVEGQAYAFQPSARDPDGQPLSFAIVNRPGWASFDAATGRLAGIPPAGSAGVYSGITISVSDGASTASLAPFAITVAGADPNHPPQISGTPSPDARVGQAYAFVPTASDVDGDALRFSSVNRPAWLGFDAATGRLSGTPQAGNEGTYTEIVVSVSDGREIAFLPPFSITVSPEPAPAANVPPTISGTPATSVAAGQAYSFQPTASDPDGQALRFTVANKPAWAAFDATNGRLSGTPSSSQAGTYANIVISVSDGTASASLPAFGIVVTPPVRSAELHWTAPTRNEDGSALTNLAGYRIRYGTSTGALTQTVNVAGAAVTTAVIEGLAAGTWHFAVSSYTNAGVEGAPTNPVSVTLQ